jgi:hypothetical protein
VAKKNFSDTFSAHKKTPFGVGKRRLAGRWTTKEFVETEDFFCWA